jgi:hypothetical protein
MPTALQAPSSGHQEEHAMRASDAMDDCPRPRAFERRFLSTFYSIPDPTADEEQHARFYHLDLAGMDHGSLRVEEQRLVLRLLLDRAPGLWLGERLVAVRRALGDG